ncbi:glycosyltransferase family 2 protein [Campylobacter sp. RM13119]|uniref:glycosyltransferase family 2 protein n=1 Tax=Campylobacter californiensis TaxID=1032243 RepID=UPI001475A3B6|nr:glycosyltransferase family 2 protein [Campylobacter sp. RM13119]MBE3605370.1 glycosyltransferase family 2 protein [Campylobacter sp. RM13119]
MKNYDVSIIVPVYNTGKYIEKCAITLFEQDFDNIEYIFINDCSTDNSMEILKTVIERYPNIRNDIKIDNNNKNIGPSFTRKRGLNISSGKYILFVDSDDWIDTDAISSLINEVKKSDADIVCYDYAKEFKNKSIIKSFFYTKDHPKSNLEFLKAILSHEISVSMCDKLINKELYKDVKFPHFSHCEDSFINLQIFYKVKKITYIARPFYHYRTNHDSLSNNFSNNQKVLDDFASFSKAVRNFLIQKDLFKDYFHNFLPNILKFTLDYANGDFKKHINNICPEANSIRYVFKINRNFIYKILYSTVFLGCPSVFIFFKKIFVNFRKFLG